MNCQRCNADRVMSVSGKTGDLFGYQVGHVDKSCTYVPSDAGIGGGDYVEFSYCLACGQIQGQFPRVLEAEIQELEDLPKEEDEIEGEDRCAPHGCRYGK